MANNPDLAISVRISYLEIYNEQLRDLLVSDSDPNAVDIQVLENGGKAPTIKGLTVRSVFTEEQALGLLFEGEINRTISEHAMNQRSSRAHCIFAIHVEVFGFSGLTAMLTAPRPSPRWSPIPSPRSPSCSSLISPALSVWQSHG